MTKKVSTTFFDLSHLRIGTKVSPASGTTFGLYIKNGLKNSDKPLFTGHVEKGMGTQLRRIAGHFDDLEAALRKKDPQELSEEQAVLDLYCETLGM